MSNFAERLRQAMFDKHYKAVDVVRGTKIGASVISRYLSGMNQPSRDNLLSLGKFLEVTPEWLLSPLDAPESIQNGHGISRDAEQLQKIIEVQGTLIDNLQKQITDKDGQIAELVKNCDALAEEVTRLGKPNKAHKELVEVIDTQKAQIEKLIAYCEGLVEEVRSLKTKLGETN